MNKGLRCIIEKGKIDWHPTTPRKFDCQPRCMCCCSNVFFFPSEERRLPSKIKKNLMIKKGLIIAKPFKKDQGCIFFDPLSQKHCTIHKYRPLRCKLYPYLPVIVPNQDKIVIIIESFAHHFRKDKKTTPNWFRCYGLGKGKDISSTIERESRIFLDKMRREYPKLIGLYLQNDVEVLIDHNEVRKYLTPTYNSWDETSIARRS